MTPFKGAVVPLGIGLLAGLSSGLFGVGGGIIMVPLFVYLLKIDQKRAHATSLAAVIPIALIGACGYWTHGNVIWPAVLFVLAGAVCGAAYGASMLHRISLPLIQVLFGSLLLLSGLRLVWSAAPHEVFHGLASDVFLVLMGLFSGTVAGLLGVGGGIFVVPALIATAGLTSLEARGTSLAVIVGTAIVGAITHARQRNIEPRVAWLTGLGGVPGAFLGVVVSHDLSENLAIKALAALIFIVGIRQLRSAMLGWARR